eukprot:c43977_g1_i1 orf=27-188(+)
MGAWVEPFGFEHPSLPHHVYKLNKSLYGLKQVPCMWYSKLTHSFKDLILSRVH